MGFKGHYKAAIIITRHTKPEPPEAITIWPPVERHHQQTDSSRQKEDIAEVSRIIIRSGSIAELVKKASAHLLLVEDTTDGDD